MVRTRGHNVLAILFGAALLLGVVATPQAGDMEPPGPPAPTMKPLPELEPRIPIHAGDLPLTITVPGSYYLAENISATGAGITISVDDVTIDLMGLTLQGGTGNGITSPAGVSRTTIRNGTVRDWGQHGLALEERAVLIDVVAENNAGNGVQLGMYSAVIDSVAELNLGHGIVVREHGVVRGSRASANGENGIWAYNSLVIDCVANNNKKNGIRVEDACYVRGCMALFNDSNRNYDKAGIWVLGNDNRIEGNHLAWNNKGMDIDGSYNVIIKNTVWTNQGGGTVYFDIAPGTTGNLIEISTSPSTAGPWSNFTP